MTQRLPSAPVSGAVLKWAREELNLALSDAGSALGVPKSTIEQWEAGNDWPTLTQLEALATYYCRSVATFFLPRPPRSSTQLMDFRSRLDQEKFELGRDTLLAVRRARWLRKQLVELDTVVPHAKPRFPRLNARKSAEAQAELVRSWAGVELRDQHAWSDEYEALKNWRAAFEHRGALVLQFKFPRSEAQGFSLREAVWPTVVLNRSDPPSARVFTLFHELTHLCLGEEGICLPAAFSDKRARPIERFCDTVAAAALVPEASVLAEPEIRRSPKDEISLGDLSRVSHRYKVSRDVMAYRLADLGRITKKNLGQLIGALRVLRNRPRPAAKGGGESAQQRSYRERGTTFTSAVGRAVDLGVLSRSEAASILGLQVAQVESGLV